MHRFHLLVAWLLLNLLVALGSSRGSARAAEPPSLACPRGQVIVLTGQAAPGVAVVATLAGRPVGGGVADAGGRWQVPLTVWERPGVYPLTVIARDDSTVLARATCYVELPVGATLTPTPTMPAASPPPTVTLAPPSPTPEAIDEPGTSTTVTVADEPTSLPVGTSPLPELSTTPLTPEPSPPAPTPVAPAPPPSADVDGPPALADAVAILGVQPHDASQPELYEYVLLVNLTPRPQRLVGWSLAHAPSGATYRLPALTLPPEGLAVVWSGHGQDDPATGTLFWPADHGRWSAGDRAELYAPDGLLAHTLSVSAEPTAEPKLEGVH